MVVPTGGWEEAGNLILTDGSSRKSSNCASISGLVQVRTTCPSALCRGEAKESTKKHCYGTSRARVVKFSSINARTDPTRLAALREVRFANWRQAFAKPASNLTVGKHWRATTSAWLVERAQKDVDSSVYIAVCRSCRSRFSRSHRTPACRGWTSSLRFLCRCNIGGDGMRVYSAQRVCLEPSRRGSLWCGSGQNL